MRSGHPHALIVDDDAETVAVLQDILAKEGYEISSASDPQTVYKNVETSSPDLILTDLHLPEMDGLAFLAELRAQARDMPVVLMTANGSLKTAVDGLKAGAFDYLSKPFLVDEVRQVARRALEQKQAPWPDHERQASTTSRCPFENLVGSSPAMVSVYKSIARVAQSDSTVLLQGESGTGKELIARDP